MAGKIVACRRMISVTMFLGGCNDFTSTIDPPTVSGRKMQTHNMKLWNIGSNTTNRSNGTASST